MREIAGRAAFTLVLLVASWASFPELWLGSLRKEGGWWTLSLPSRPAVTSAQLALGATAWAIAFQEPVQPAWVELMASSPSEWSIYVDLHGHQHSHIWGQVREPPRDAGTGVRQLRLMATEVEEEWQRSRATVASLEQGERWLDAIEAALSLPYDLRDGEINAALLAYLEAAGLGRQRTAVELSVASAAREWGAPAAKLKDRLGAVPLRAGAGWISPGRPPWLPAELAGRAAPLLARLGDLSARSAPGGGPVPAIDALHRREALVTGAWMALAGIAACLAVWLWLLVAWAVMRSGTPARARATSRHGFARICLCLALVLPLAMLRPSSLSIPTVMLGLAMGVAWNARHRARAAGAYPIASWGADLRMLAACLGMSALLAVVWVLSIGRAEDEARLALHSAAGALAVGALGCAMSAWLLGQPRDRGRTRLRAAVVVLTLVAAVLTGFFRLHSSAGAFELVQSPAVVFFWLPVIAIVHWVVRQLLPGFAAGALTAHRLVGGAAAVLLVYALACWAQGASAVALLPVLVATVLVVAVVLFEAARARSTSEKGERRGALVDSTYAWVCALGDGLVVLSLVTLAFSLVARALVEIETHQLLTAALLR